MQNINRTSYPRQVDCPIPGPLIGLFQLKHAPTNRVHAARLRGWLPADLQLSQRKSQRALDLIGKMRQNFERISLEMDLSGLIVLPQRPPSGNSSPALDYTISAIFACPLSLSSTVFSPAASIDGSHRLVCSRSRAWADGFSLLLRCGKLVKCFFIPISALDSFNPTSASRYPNKSGRFPGPIWYSKNKGKESKRPPVSAAFFHCPKGSHRLSSSQRSGCGGRQSLQRDPPSVLFAASCRIPKETFRNPFQ